VQLNSSGLGCPDWPQCTTTSLAAAHSAGQTSLNTAIEFGNRLLTFPLAAIAVLTFIACLHYKPDRRRRDLALLSAALPGGVFAQAVAGGIVVITRLNPVMVAAHFLLSSAILAAAVVLHARAGEGPGPARPLVRADLRILAVLLTAAAALSSPAWPYRDRSATPSTSAACPPDWCGCTSLCRPCCGSSYSGCTCRPANASPFRPWPSPVRAQRPQQGIRKHPA
jgi:heme A synthase